MTDNLDELLQPRSGPPVSNRAFDVSLQVLRRNARWRLVGKLSLIPILLTLGIAIGWMANASPKPESVPSPPAPPPVIEDGSSFVTLTPNQLELRAELADDAKTVAAMYKLAGDGYLARQRYDEASRCYRMSVQNSGETTLNRSDSWLLCSIKTQTLKEGMR